MSKKFLVPIDMNGLEIQNFLAHKLAAAPTGVAGKVYFNTVDHKLYYHNGTTWVDLSANTNTTYTLTQSGSTITLTGSDGTTMTVSGEENVQADWNQTTTTADDYIKNKPTIPADKVFFAIPDTTTYTELGNAVDAGKIVLAYYSNHLYTLTYRNGNSFGFSCVEYTGSTPFKILGMRAYQNAGTQTVWHFNLGYDIAKLASPEFTGTPKAPTATAGTNTTQIATTAFVKNAVDTAVTGATAYQGTVGGSTFAPTNYKAGWYWIVATAGTYVGQTCEAGDMIFASADGTTYSASDFDVVQTNIEGAITSINGTSPISVTGSGSSRTVSISASSDSSAGSMSAAHYTKLNGLTATKTGTVTIASGSTSVDANVSNIIAYTAKDASTGEEVVLDVTKSSNKVTFSIASSYSHAINIDYITLV